MLKTVTVVLFPVFAFGFPPGNGDARPNSYPSPITPAVIPEPT